MNPRTALITVITGQAGSYPAERLLEAARLACPAARGYQGVLDMALVRRELEQMQPDGQLAASGSQP